MSGSGPDRTNSPGGNYMRVAFYGLLAATAVLVTGCSPAVGSPDWCKQVTAKMQNNPNALEEMAKMSQEEQQGLTKCIEHAMSGALGQ